MNRRALKVLAGALSLSIVAVLFAGLDNLPRNVRKQIDSERAALSQTQREVSAARQEVDRELQAEAGLFAGIPASRQWTGQFDHAGVLLASAAKDLGTLSQLEQRNRRRDGDRVRQLIAEEQRLRKQALEESAAVRREASHWVELKASLPSAVAEMDRDRAAVEQFDLAPVDAAVQKTSADWPGKKADLEARLTALHQTPADAQRIWLSTTEARKRVAEGAQTGEDAGVVLNAAAQLKSAAAGLPGRAAALGALAGQLYESWDKVLVDLDRPGPSGSVCQQKVRTVRVHFDDASAKPGATTYEERWQDVSRTEWESAKPNLGMAIAHKPAGKYDSEADRVSQPAGFVYMASPAQGSNQYGRWEHRDGHDFWVFYGQYALLRDLLFNHRYTPPDRGDWDGYQTSRDRGQTYYGKDSSGSQKYGAGGTETQERYSGSQYVRGGGYRDSKYATKPGSYRDSEYATPMARRPEADRAPRAFGRNARPEPPRASPPPSRNFRSVPSPKPFRMPSMPGRRFGR
jgi:hypothetical protein